MYAHICARVYMYTNLQIVLTGQRCTFLYQKSQNHFHRTMTHFRASGDSRDLGRRHLFSKDCEFQSSYFENRSWLQLSLWGFVIAREMDFAYMRPRAHMWEISKRVGVTCSLSFAFRSVCAETREMLRLYRALNRLHGLNSSHSTIAVKTISVMQSSSLCAFLQSTWRP